MDHALTLAAQHDFQQWRELRKKRGSIPDNLWQRVLPLLNQYPISKICNALSLNTAQIRSKLSTYSHTKDGKSKETFVEVSLKSAAMDSVMSEISIKFIRKDGSASSDENIKPLLSAKFCQYTVNPFRGSTLA